jgi:hypothetical protein
MRNRSVFFYILLFLLFSTPGKSQKNCGTENKRFEALARNPGLIKERQMIEAFTKNLYSLRFVLG